MKKSFSKNQQIFFLTLSAVLAISAVVWIFVFPKHNILQKVDPPNPSLAGQVVNDSVNLPKQTNSAGGTQANTKNREGSQTTEITASSGITPKDVNQNQISITINAGNVSVGVTSDDSATLLNDLTKARDSGKIVLEGKQYSGLGFYVTKIGSLEESNGKYLIYYVNGKEASVGISSYIPKDGDVIDWKLN